MSVNAPENKDDRTLIGDLRIHDAAFEFFFKQHYSHLCVYCKFKYGFDIDLTKDVISTCFIRLWEVHETLPADTRLTSYLYKIIDNHCLNILKHDKVKRKHLHYVLRSGSESVSPATFDSIDLKQLRKAIDSAMDELPEQMRRIFELSRVQGLKYSEIAHQLSISVNTVETQMVRALARLRVKLSEFLTICIIIFIFS